MSWITQEQGIASDNSSYLGVFDSVAVTNPTGGGASYQCNDTSMGFILDLPTNGGKFGSLIQKTQTFFPFNLGGYTQIMATFPRPVSTGSILIVVFTGTFLSSLFNTAVTDTTNRAWSGPYPNNGHVPGESNTLQVLLATSGGGTPTVTVAQTGFSDFTAGSIILLEYQNLAGTIPSNASNFNVGGPATLNIGNVTPGAGNDLLLMAISIMPACPNPNVIPIGGGFVAPPPATIIPITNLPISYLPFCFTNKCVIFE